MTTTYALLPISASAYREIKGLLEAAGYQHLLAGDRIVLGPIGLVAKDEAHPSALTDWEQSNEGPWRKGSTDAELRAQDDYREGIARAFK